jgi:hypothetical protein
MFHFLISLTVLMNLFSSFRSSGTQLPATWDKNFTLSLSLHGSLSGGHVQVSFGYNSCEYEFFSVREAPVKGSFALTASQRNAILKKLKACQLDEIKSDQLLRPGKDGWSSTIYYGLHCVEGGSFSGLSDRDRNNFHEAYQYLEALVWKKARKK